MKTKSIRVEIRKEKGLYFAESSDLPGLKLAHRERDQLMEEVATVIKYLYEEDGKQVSVERIENADGSSATYVVKEVLKAVCG